MLSPEISINPDTEPIGDTDNRAAELSRMAGRNETSASASESKRERGDPVAKLRNEAVLTSNGLLCFEGEQLRRTCNR